MNVVVGTKVRVLFNGKWFEGSVVEKGASGAVTVEYQTSKGSCQAYETGEWREYVVVK